MPAASAAVSIGGGNGAGRPHRSDLPWSDHVRIDGCSLAFTGIDNIYVKCH